MLITNIINIYANYAANVVIIFDMSKEKTDYLFDYYHHTYFARISPLFTHEFLCDEQALVEFTLSIHCIEIR